MQKWVPSMRAVILHSISKTGTQIGNMGENALDIALRRLKKDKNTRGLVVIISYDGIRKYKKTLTLTEWTSVCLDEGHKIRNPTTIVSTICKSLPAFHRIILSGTPIQNNLIELWSLVDFIYPGRLGM